MSELGYKKSAEFDGGVSWAHETGTYLVFVQVEKKYIDARNTRHGHGLNHIAFMGDDLESLDNLQEKLESKQIKILKRDGKYLCFEDPNDFAVEVYAK